MTERDYAPLSIACVRGLCDKMYEKRKFAGGEIEKMVKDFSDANNTSQIKRLIRVLGQDLMASTNPNVKNGALMGLSSVAVGLGQGCVSYLSELSHPIVACFSESESRVRYQAAEALFNVVKIARGAALAHFALLFEALARLAADPEPQVRQAAELLDRLLKDIVTESSEFDVSSFVPLLRERLYARGAPARQFAASWVSVLDAVPGARLLEHLPDLLDGLLHMLDDNNQEIRRMVDVQLSEFLRSIRLSPARADLPAMLNILITHAQAPEELLQLTALTWLKQFVSLGGAAMLPHASGVLAAALPALAYTDEQRRGIRDMAATVNLQLIKLVTEQPSAAAPPVEAAGAEAEAPAPAAPSDRLNVPCVVGVVTGMLRHHSLHTKVAALDWILHLYSKMTAEMCTETEVVFVCCVGCLTDAADDVVRRALAVLAEICSCTRQTGELDSSPYYYRLLRALVRMLAADEALLEDRGAFIVRQLCVLLNAEDVYRALSAILEGERELRFAATAVDVLSTILLTAAELYHLRQQLRSRHSKAWRPLFARLFPCWCHSPVALLALCLLTHNYTLCQALIATFGDLEITVDFLTEVDKLVQLIESPIFAYLRLELLSGEQSGALRGALYGLLMLLPQSDAFHTLRTRLQCAPPPPPTPLPPHTQGEAGAGAGAESGEELSISALVAQFERVQAAHRRYRMMERTRPAPASAAAPASAPAAPATHHTAADKHYS